jgi:hypothetical protein
MLTEHSQVTTAAVPQSSNITPTPTSTSGVTRGAAAGIGIGVGIGLFLLCVLGFLCLRKRKRSGGEVPVPVQEYAFPSKPELAGNSGVQVNMTELPANACPVSGTQLYMTELPESTVFPPRQHMTELPVDFDQSSGLHMTGLTADFGQPSGTQLPMASPEGANPDILLVPESFNSQSTQQNLSSSPVDNFLSSSTQVLSPEPPNELAILQEQQANIESKRRALLQLKELEEEEESIKKRIKELKAASAST